MATDGSRAPFGFGIRADFGFTKATNMPSLVSSNLSCLVVLRKAVTLESSARLQPGGYDGAQGTARPAEDRRDACPTTLFVKPIERTAEFISRTRFFGGGEEIMDG